ncbi:glycine--tRNA ligase subunit beta [Gallionella capsiferriformans]|jgi:glycyl-tRNA synthetase beta chain|uniref:Glycine--tRNA ligase beta subunit n=1 Tax=Gallionella capsiferriformans (strain ES-2) TaxID=395494 RepID=D9SI15_GALCS|nr:glycine--tRNA ligase subunit beta [Gallionella capsiferriformans]ADL56105.1 glycyl-tRNA synthetase, beta subunit [Gallionella capsiferriformans ES-2]
MSTKNLLVELFVEELPPKSLKKLGESFSQVLSASLVAQNLVLPGTEITSFASPRRLAVHVEGVIAQAADKSVSLKLMPVKVGLDAAGNATPALLKKLAGLGADVSVVSSLRTEMDGKAEALYFDSLVPGVKLVDGLQRALNDALAKLPIARVMTYPDPTGDGWSTVNFVRPAHSLVALYGRKIVPVSVLGLTAGNVTQGHRFEASVDAIVLEDADSYARQLETEGAVIASFAQRRAEIVRQLAKMAAKEGLQAIHDDDLLDEVTALVERPNVLMGRFEETYLEVPPECLILTMKANQKYFPLLEVSGRLSNKFLIVSNISPKDASLVIGGNERVVRPRLADAKFFFDQDRKKPLDARVLGLSRVVYHNKLGTQGERVERVQAIARAIGMQLGGEAQALQADQAALLAKADLLTDMVGEFPELQGIMGRYYAQHDGLTDEVAFAIEDHYKPRFAGDTLPRNSTGICVALADKLETLVGMFGIGQIPTGDRDPFALRRHALGVIRMLVEKQLPLTLTDLVAGAFAGFSKGLLADAQAEVETFIFDRIGGMMREQGYTANQVDAVLAPRPQRLSEIPMRLDAVRAFAALPESAALAAANKRVGNILKKVEGEVSVEVDRARLVEDAELALYQALQSIATDADAAFAAGDYTTSLQALAALRAPVDAFFDSVMVNADDPALRANRLSLLARLHQAMNRVADLSRLAA